MRRRKREATLREEDLLESERVKEDTRRRLARIEAEMRVLIPSIKLQKRRANG